MPRHIGDHHPVGFGQVGNNAKPLGGVLSRAVQQHDRRAVSTFKHGRPYTGQIQCSLRQWYRGQQPCAGIPIGCKWFASSPPVCFSAWAMGFLLACVSRLASNKCYGGEPACASAKAPKLRRTRKWVFLRIPLSDELVLVSVACRCCARRNVQLAEEIADMPVDGPAAHEKF